MNITKVITITFVIGCFCSCVRNESADENDTNMKNEYKIRAIFMTPDSLRSEEEKALFQKIMDVIYENYIIKDGEIEFPISRKELTEMGLPEIVYDIIKKDIGDMNRGLGTPMFPRQESLDAFRKAQEEYLAKRKVRK